MFNSRSVRGQEKQVRSWELLPVFCPVGFVSPLPTRIGCILVTDTGGFEFEPPILLLVSPLASISPLAGAASVGVLTPTAV